MLQMAARVPVVMLSIDVANSPDRGDLTVEASVDKILDMLWTGQALGAVGGPPCETWSKGRANPPPNGGLKPRILRSREFLWGLVARSPSEWKQVMLGNRLLQTMLQVVYVCAAVGAACVLEHPLEPEAPHLPSIWRLPEMGAVY
eukprot:2560648-Pyramimonas_sp.AAC.1